MATTTPGGGQPTDPRDPELDLEDAAARERVVDVALRRFSEAPFPEAKLETIARESGITKRMIHYHFGNKRGLYREAVIEALTRLRPDPEQLVIHTNIPVDGIRTTVGALFHRHRENPQSVNLLRMEAIQRIITYHELSPIADQSPLILHLDKLLLAGQDAGAFRPGISAYDILFLISAVLSYHQRNPDMTANLYGVDLTNAQNVDGIHRMTVDLVLAFLTSNIPGTGHESYLASRDAADDSGTGPGLIYE